jgi:hypothetical protein
MAALTQVANPTALAKPVPDSMAPAVSLGQFVCTHVRAATWSDWVQPFRVAHWTSRAQLGSVKQVLASEAQLAQTQASTQVAPESTIAKIAVQVAWLASGPASALAPPVPPPVPAVPVPPPPVLAPPVPPPAPPLPAVPPGAALSSPPHPSATMPLRPNVVIPTMQAAHVIRRCFI